MEQDAFRIKIELETLVKRLLEDSARRVVCSVQEDILIRLIERLIEKRDETTDDINRGLTISVDLLLTHLETTRKICS